MRVGHKLSYTVTEVTLCWDQVLQAMELLNPGACGWDCAEDWYQSPCTWSVQWSQGWMEIPGAQESSSRCNSQDSGDLKTRSRIWRFNCNSLYCSILNLHLLYAKYIHKPAAVQRLTISGRSSWLYTVLISLLSIPFCTETKASKLKYFPELNAWYLDCSTVISSYREQDKKILLSSCGFCWCLGTIASVSI